jgi:hypothetical protein
VNRIPDESQTGSKYSNLAEALADEDLTLRAENAGLRNDVAWCREVITAAVARLHEGTSRPPNGSDPKTPGPESSWTH